MPGNPSTASSPNRPRCSRTTSSSTCSTWARNGSPPAPMACTRAATARRMRSSGPAPASTSPDRSGKVLVGLHNQVATEHRVFGTRNQGGVSKQVETPPSLHALSAKSAQANSSRVIAGRRFFGFHGLFLRDLRRRLGDFHAIHLHEPAALEVVDAGPRAALIAYDRGAIAVGIVAELDT